MKRLCLDTFCLINKDSIEGKKLMSEPSKYLIGIQFYVSARLLSEANKRIECRNRVIIKTGIKEYMSIRSFLKLLILSNAGDKILEVKSLNLKSNAFFFLPFSEEKN